MVTTGNNGEHLTTPEIHSTFEMAPLTSTQNSNAGMATQIIDIYKTPSNTQLFYLLLIKEQNQIERYLAFYFGIYIN